MAPPKKLLNQRVMTMMTRSHALCLIPFAALVGCGGDNPVETHYYTGSVFDGADGVQLGIPGNAGYDIAVDYAGRYQKGTVDSRGNFQLPPIPAYNDFSVYIDAPGYRSFVAHEEQWVDAYHADRSYFYVAYMFKGDLIVLPVPVSVTLDDSALEPSGEIRLRPTNLSALYDTAAEQPPAVTETPGTATIPPVTIPQHGAQLWVNDNDLLSKTVTIPFDKGTATIAAGLVYGVPYQVVVANVAGYQYTEKTTFTAGTDSSIAVTLSKLAVPTLKVVYVSNDADALSPDGTLTIVFNEPVELDPTVDLSLTRWNIDSAFSISPSGSIFGDANHNLQWNELALETGTLTELKRGTTMTLAPNGMSLTFTWNRAAGLQMSDPTDPIDSVTWGSLGSISLRPAGAKTTAETRTLSTLLGGKTSETVKLTPKP